MVVAVNARFLAAGLLEGYGYFTREVTDILSRRYRQHRFVLLVDRPLQQDGGFAANVSIKQVRPQARHPLLWKIWFDLSLPPVLKQVGADVFLSPDGFCSLRAKLPQCMVVHDLGFLHYPQFYKSLHAAYYRHYMPQFLRKAAAVAAVSQFTRADLLKQYALPEKKIDVVYNGVKKIFRPLSFNEQQAVKEQFTEGREFFLHTGAIHPRKNLINLLKAFSIFKKRLQSSMKLVLAGRLAWKNEEFLQLLKTYKYRHDVVLTGYLPEADLAALTAAAYAMVYPSLFEGFGVPVLEALAAGVPVLTSRGSAMEELARHAALYFNAADFNDMGEKLMLIYKDEGLREKLLENGREIRPQYSWEKTADLLWASMMKGIEG